LELDLLDALIATRLAVSVVNAAVQRAAVPENAYLTISEGPAWAALERLDALPPRFLGYLLREACGLPPVPTSVAVSAWLRDHPDELGPLVPPDLLREGVGIDLSVASPLLGDLRTLADPSHWGRVIGTAIEQAGGRMGVGRYDEARLVYTSDAFREAGNDGPNGAPSTWD
jgi:hypothetical protein